MISPIRVALATDSGSEVDGHFGSCKVFAVWDVTPDAVMFVAARSTAEADDDEDRNAARATLIQDCHIACFQSIGAPAAAKVVRVGTHPMKVAAGVTMDEMLARLQEALRHPPPWLAKVMGVARPAAPGWGQYSGEE